MSKPHDAKTTNVLRKKVLPNELEQLLEALRTLLPKPVLRDELTKILTVDLRMLVRHGVSLEVINQKLAMHDGHITQSFYDTLGRAPRRGRSTSSQLNDASAAAGSSISDALSTVAADVEMPVKPAPSSPKMSTLYSESASPTTVGDGQFEFDEPRSQNASLETPVAAATVPEQFVDWRLSLRQRGSRSE